MKIIDQQITDAVRRHRPFSGGNTTVVPANGKALTVHLYGTCICLVDEDGRVTLSHGGFVTATTAARMNAVIRGLGLPGQVGRKGQAMFYSEQGRDRIAIGHGRTIVRDVDVAARYSAKLDELHQRAEASIDDLIAQASAELLRPFCERTGYSFRGGMGTWAFYTGEGSFSDNETLGSFIWGENLEGIPEPLLRVLKLSYPLNPGQELGSLFPDFTPAR